MEDHKRMYLQEFLAQSEVSVEGFIELIKEKETRLRNFYMRKPMGLAANTS
jgi:hypothetical protein